MPYASLGLLMLSLQGGNGDQVDAPSPAEMTRAAAADERILLVTTGTDLGLAVWDGAGLEVVSTAPGAGRNAVLLGDTILFKECPGSTMLIEAFSDGRLWTVVEGCGLCGPFGAGRGFLYSDGDGVHLMDMSFSETAVWTCAAGSPSACLSGSELWFVDRDGMLMVADRNSGPHALLEGAAEVDGGPGIILVRMIDGSFRLIDQATRGTILDEENALWPGFVGDGSILFSRPDGRGAGTCMMTDPSGCTESVADDAALRPLMIPGRGIVWTDAETGALTGPGLAGETIRFQAETAAGTRPDIEPAAVVDVPWMHQRWDTPDWFNGSWSCGPTSCIMAAQYYDRLTPDSIWCSSPSPGHWSSWGGYIPEEFTFLGFTYDIPGLSPGDVWVEGAHGFICRDAGGAYWNYICLFLEQAGLESGWAGTSWSVLTSDLLNAWPVVCSSTIYYSGGTYGHIILFTGYYTDHSVVVNDPYGDANLTGWGQSSNYPDGEACIYDWPGYNNGHLEIGAVNQLFHARHDLRVLPDTLVDDLSLGFEKLGPCRFWHEETSGWDGGFWWTWATASPPDTCFAKWKPVLPWAGDYEVSVYIPSSQASATGLYRLSTPSGTITIPLDQSGFHGEWAVLGTFSLQPGDSLYLGDHNGQGGQRLAFDAARFHPLGLSAGLETGPGNLLEVTNPSRGGAGYSISNQRPEGSSIYVTLRDAAGRTVISNRIGEDLDGGILGADLPPGLYFITLIMDSEAVESRPVVILGSSP